jgi:hypothetical protein
MRQAFYIDNGSNKDLPNYLTRILPSEINSCDIDQVAFWLIDMSDWQKGWGSLCSIRANLQASFYLKPVVYLMDTSEVPGEISRAADGKIDAFSLTQAGIEDWISKLESINRWIDHLSSRGDTADSNVAFKVLRLIASRNVELKPLKTVRRVSGYVYPLLEPLFAKRDTGALEILSFLKIQSLLSERFATKAHFCAHCSSAFLNFKETCPHCKSDDLRVDELVHHFKCAYTSELSDFQQGDRLVCPKCERHLRHIGVDYDKPSTVSHCNECDHRFQDAIVMTDCYGCGRSSEPANQDVRQINNYSISALGQTAAYYGLDALFTSLLESEMHLYSASAFKDFFFVELSRINRYKKTESSLAMIHFIGLESLYTDLGNKAKQVFSELSSIFKAVFRDSDIITAHNESIFYVLMTETSYDSAHIGIARLEESVSALFENNLKANFKVRVQIQKIDSDLNLDVALEQFLISVGEAS